jgi:hypothetical protein
MNMTAEPENNIATGTKATNALSNAVSIVGQSPPVPWLTVLTRTRFGSEYSRRQQREAAE